MSEVTLQVGGRSYTIACADGEEAHVRHLAGIVDAKLAALGGNRLPGDTKNLLFAALILADEAEEARRAATPPAAEPGPSVSAMPRDSILRGLDALADRLEQVAHSLETGPANA